MNIVFAKIRNPFFGWMLATCALTSAWAATPSAPLPASLHSALQALLQSTWLQALPPAQREGAQMRATFSAPRGAALTPCPSGWEFGKWELKRMARISIPLSCDGLRGSVVAQIEASAPLWTLRSALPAGQPLQARDLELRTQPVAMLSDLEPAHHLEGAYLKTDGAAGQVIRARDVVRPIAARKGNKVEIRAQGEGVQVSVMGIATGTGKLGDTITVRNARTGRSIKGLLISPGVVLAGEATPGTPLMAEESGD